MAVEHYECVHGEFAGDTESEGLSVDNSGIPDSSEAQRSPSYGDGLTSDDVVDDLVSAEQWYGVCSCIVVDLDSQHEFGVVVSLIGFCDGFKELWVADGWNGVRRE